MAEPNPSYPQLRPADERVALEERLEHCRREVLRVAERVRPEWATTRLLDASNLTVAGIVRHLALVEDHWFQRHLVGKSMPPPWGPDNDSPEASMRLSATDTLASTAGLYVAACERSRSAAAGVASLDTDAAVDSFGSGPVNLRWVLTHLIAETARHLGHLDLLADRAADLTKQTTTNARRFSGCIVAVHAHPDDESSKAAATISRYAAAGVRCVLVCCTDGRGGRAPLGSDRPLVDVRAAELDRAAAILGYSIVHRLGHHDSGMHATEPDGFAHVPLAQVAIELHQILRIEQPDVVITYDPEYAAGHPDHQHAHDATVAAFATFMATRDRAAALYGTRTHSPRKLQAMHEWLAARSEPSPYADAIGRPDPSTTSVHVADHLETAHRALRQHASQVDADDPWFFAVPAQALRTVYPYEDFTRLAATNGYDDAHSRTDLFDGLDP